jgi:hypothetical protein
MATIRLTKDNIIKVKYPPELLPCACTFTIPAKSEVSPRIFEIPEISTRRTFRLIALAYIAQPRHDDVELRIRVDGEDRDYRNTALLKQYPEAEELYELATSNIRANYFNLSTADISSYCYYGVWVLTPSIAEKFLFYNLDKTKLTATERRLLEKYGVDKTVEKGIVPRYLPSLPLKDLMTRLEVEYQLSRKEIAKTVILDLGTADPLDNLIAMLEPDRTKNEFYLLTSIAPEKPPDPAYNTTIIIDRDEQESYIQFETYPLDLNTPLQMWIPCLERFRIYASTATAISNYKVRLTYRVCRYSNLLRARWETEEFIEETGLVELAERVKVGVW